MQFGIYEIAMYKANWISLYVFGFYLYVVLSTTQSMFTLLLKKSVVLLEYFFFYPRKT